MDIMYENNSNIMGFLFLIFIIFIIIILICSFIMWIFTTIGKWKVFEKAGKPGWAAIIPFYDTWVLYEIGGIKPIYMIFTAISVFLTSVGNIVYSFGQSKNIIELTIISIPINLLSIVFSITGLIFTIMASVNIAKSFNKDSAYGLGLAFLSFIFYPMLGFSKTAKYQKLDK